MILTSSYEVALKLATWVHRFLQRQQSLSSSQPLYVRVIAVVRDGFLRCLRATKQRTQFHWPGDALTNIVNDVVSDEIVLYFEE
jgi:hypothetical protein